jgi:hypothetical protein
MISSVFHCLYLARFNVYIFNLTLHFVCFLKPILPDSDKKGGASQEMRRLAMW